MANYKYSSKIESEHIARAVGRDLPISTKQAIEICDTIRGMNLVKAKTLLENVIKEKAAIAYKKFCGGVGHRTQVAGAGRYPKKASTELLSLLKSVEANAQNKGLTVASLEIVHINAQKSANQWHYGRQRRVSMKRTHVELIVEEKVSKTKEKPSIDKKEKAQTEVKPKVEAKVAEKPIAPVEKKATEEKKESVTKVEEKKPEPKSESKPIEKKVENKVATPVEKTETTKVEAKEEKPQEEVKKND